jgi:hypothetical protein
MSKPTQICHRLATPHAQNTQDPAKESQVPKLQKNREHRPPSPALHLELQESTGRRLLSPAKESQDPELQGNTEHTLPSPARDKEFQGNKESMLPSPPARDQEL